MSRISNAVDFMLTAHAGMKRKTLDIPYAVHPLDVWVTLMREGADEDTQIAGLLHDVVEDTEIPLMTIRNCSVSQGADLVSELTEEKKVGWTSEQKKLTWRERKLANLERCKSPQAKFIKLADRLSNSKDLVREYRTHGDRLGKGFNMSRNGQEWYYETTLDHLTEFHLTESYEALFELQGTIRVANCQSASL